MSGGKTRIVTQRGDILDLKEKVLKSTEF